jgi:hypothetical protein
LQHTDSVLHCFKLFWRSNWKIEKEK